VLTASEKRFIKSWEDQRKGGRFQYYLLYIFAGTFVAVLVLAFLTAVLGLGLPENILRITIGSFCIVTVGTVLSWGRNEKKFKSIIQREIKEGMKRDEEGGMS
jgi:hypothetical protein